MSKTVIIGILAVIVILGAGWYYWQGQEGVTFDPNKPYAISDEVGGESTGATGQRGSLKALLAMSTAQECDVAIDLNNVDSESKVYVAGGKMRGDIVSETGGVRTTAHIIVDGNTMYNWMDGMSSGVKFNLAGATTGPTGSNAAVSLDQTVDYNCRPWTPDASKFMVPSAITFTDFGAGLPSLPTGY